MFRGFKKVTNFGFSKTLFLTLLLLPRLVANCRSYCHPPPVPLDASLGADEDPQAGLLQDADVVVVGVPHGPAGGVLLGLLGRRGVDEATVALGPLLEGVITLTGLEKKGGNM